MNDTWRIWNKDDSVEQRTFKRVKGELPEMESTKQLVEIISNIYMPGMKILDIGCAAGHYYNGLLRIDNAINYHGVDATSTYIEFANKYFRDKPNTNFEVADIYDLPKKFYGKYDIVFCCNVILHLPNFQVPLKNIITASKKYCIIRTLISDKTHLSKLLYTDSFDKNGEPTNFVFQNTYSYKIFKKFIHELGDYKLEFIEDKFDPKSINEEYRSFKIQQSAVTNVNNGIQISGSKVFEWKWLKITK